MAPSRSGTRPGSYTTRGDVTQGGLLPANAEAWAKLAKPDGSNTTRLIQAGLAWHRAGIDAETATSWFQMDGWTPEDALPWYLADFTPRDAELCDGLIFYAEQQHRPGQPKPSDVDEWLQSGLPPAWVCRALLLGLNTVSQARDLYEAKGRDQHLAGTIDLMRDVFQVGPLGE